MSWFLHPAMAWSALGLLSIPILIHLLNRRKLRKLDWAAMEFLLAALKKNRRRLQIEQLILLACRVALMVLLAFFLARPLLSGGGFGWLASAFQSEEKIFILDDSLSTQARGGDQTAFERGREALSAALRRLSEEGGRDRVTLLRSSRPETPILRGAIVDRQRAAQVSQSLSTLEATGCELDLTNSLDSILQQAATSTESGHRPRAVAILTDLRATDWTDGKGGPNPALRDALKKLTDNPETPSRVVLLDTGKGQTSNVAVTDVSVEGGRPTVGLPTSLKVAVQNFGREPARNVRLRIAFGPASGGQAGEGSSSLGPPIESIAPGETAFGSLNVTFREEGQYWCRASLSVDGDTLEADNTFRLVLKVVAATEVLVIDGEPSPEVFEAESDFLVRSLNPGGDAQSGIQPLVTIDDNLPRGDLSRFGCVFVANVYSLAADFRQRLARYVENGGHIVFFLGDQIDASVYAREWSPREEKDGDAPESSKNDDAPVIDLLPAKIGELQVEDEAPVTLEPSYDHYLFRFLRDGGERFLSEVEFRRYFEVAPLPTSRIVARFEGASGPAAILERTIGAGSVFLVTSSADMEWNDWPRHPTYLAFLHRLMEQLGRTSGKEPDHLCGSEIHLDTDPSLHTQQLRFRSTNYPNASEKTLMASPISAQSKSSESLFRFEIADAFQPGHCFVQFQNRSGEEQPWRAFVVRSAATESDLRRISADELSTLYPDLPIEVVEDPIRFVNAGRGRFEISDLILAAFFVLLLIEGALACLFAHHRKVSVSATRERTP